MTKKEEVSDAPPLGPAVRIGRASTGRQFRLDSLVTDAASVLLDGLLASELSLELDLGLALQSSPMPLAVLPVRDASPALETLLPVEASLTLEASLSGDGISRV